MTGVQTCALPILSKKHVVDTLSVRHQEKPIYWDFPPGSALDGCLEEFSQWEISGSATTLGFWGRVHVYDGGYSEIQKLAVSTVLDVEILEDLRASGCEIYYPESEATEAALGYPFALAVHERFVAISKLRGKQPNG